MTALEGIICRVRYYRGKRDYVLTDGRSEHTIFSDDNLQPGSCVIVEGEMAVGGIRASRVEVLVQDRAAKALEKVREAIAQGSTLPEAPILLEDELTKRMWPAIRNAALELIVAKKLGRSVMLRFHGDADGICGAFAITGVLPSKAFQQNSAIYSVKDALRDIAAIGQESMPMVVLLDFGSSDACAEGLNLLRAAGMGCMVIDHHPFSRKDDSRILNPFSFSDDASGYTAGYLACEVAAACGLDKEEALSLASIACSGDKSQIIRNGPDEAKKAMVLDFLASHVSFGNNLDFYRKVMGKEELFSSLALQADETIADAAKKALSRMKRSESGALVVAVFSLEGIALRGEWPPSSKITTRVFDTLRLQEPEKPVLCIGYTERSVIVRLNDSAAGLGLSANDLAEQVKKSMADFVEGGGGHVKAGAIRAKEGFVKEVVNELLRQVESAISGAGKA